VVGRVIGSPTAIVLDTSAVLRWTLQPESLSVAAQRATADALQANVCFVSTISFWEIALKARQGRLRIGLPIEEYVSRVEQISGLSVLPVDTATWLHNVRLEWAHRDPADRTIVATATMRRASIVTTDRAIAAFFRNTIQ
jgi:PIN domain nuclease of toxin-antitoxin system